MPPQNSLGRGLAGLSKPGAKAKKPAAKTDNNSMTIETPTIIPKGSIVDKATGKPQYTLPSDRPAGTPPALTRT
jgi:hypothetical protein